MGEVSDLVMRDDFNKTLESAIEAFIELGVDDAKIYELLHKYFGMDSIKDAILYTTYARINTQYLKLKSYKLKQGMSSPAFGQYLREADFFDRMENEPKLRTLTPEKLAAALEKSQ